MRNLIFKITAWLSLILGISLGVGVLALVYFVPFWIPEAKLTKLVLVEVALIIIGFLIIVVGFGFFELFRSSIKVEKKLEALQKHYRGIERNEALNY